MVRTELEFLHKHTAAFPTLACGCALSSIQRGSGTLGTELAKKAAVVGSDVLLDEPSLVVEA